MNLFLFILCPFTSHLHAPLTQYYTSPSILKKCLFDTDSCKDWCVGTEKMIEKGDMTVCKSLGKVAVTFFCN